MSASPAERYPGPHDMPFLQQSWQRAWAALDLRSDPALCEQLLACYSESHRKYHTLGQELTRWLANKLA